MPMIDTSALVEGFYDPPYPPVNPAVEQAEEETIAWLWRIGFLTTPVQEAHLRSFKFGLYHGICTPSVDLAHLLIGVKWFCWGSLADDQYDNFDWGERDRRMAAVLRDMRTVLSGGTPAGTPNAVIKGFADYWPELTAGLSPRRRRRITDHFLDYVQAIAFQNRYHAAARIPDAATFMMMRRNTIAMIFQADVLEIVSQLHIPDPLRDSLLFREMVWCFADVTAWHNDVYGLEKDIADGQTCNVVRVTAASEDCTLQQAVDRVLHRAERRQLLFLELQRQLPDLAAHLDLSPDAATQAARLAQDLRAYTYANLVWIQHTRRYDLDRPRIRGTFDDVLSSRQRDRTPASGPPRSPAPSDPGHPLHLPRME
ncbi:terpene synthase family protein [Nocardia sp. NPDC051929]|uniref:terpene synthase family protein n=1 Tax=unclassified Nocardia TaxID=2637762 RepID=UPI00341B3B01